MNYNFLNNSFKTISLKNIIAVSLGSALYLIISIGLIGFKTDQIILVLVFNFLYYITVYTRNFILGFLIFIVFWIIFDYMKIFPNYRVNDIHISDLYLREKSIFGISENGIILTPNEYFELHSNNALDIASGIFYLNWVPVPLILAFYFFRKNRIEFLNFSLVFLFVNIIGFFLYYLYPAAPPWYVKQNGFDLYFNTPGNEAGLARFDEYFGINVFHSLYSKSSNVFAAMPSLHSAYPVVALYFGIRNRLGVINLILAIFMFGVWFSAVYSGHHYIQDVIAGASCAAFGLFIYEKLFLKSNTFRNFLFSYKKLITQKH